jgi:septation ring formation regulator EzrA
MLQKEILTQMITFNKTAFDNAFNVMMALQEQMEKTFRMYMEQVPGFPAEGRKVLEEWIAVYKKGCEDFKKNVDESFKKVETFIQ